MGFEDLEDFNDLNELPPFEDDMDDLPNMGGSEPSGASRTFKIIGALLFSVVLVVVILLVIVALNGGDDLSSQDQQATNIAQTNEAVVVSYGATQTAIEVAGVASRTAAFGIELTATVTAQAIQTQQAGTATQVVVQQTADAAASETAAAREEATQRAQQTAEAATIVASTLRGSAMINGVPLSNVPLMLYKDDGDGIFNSGQVTPPPSATEPAATNAVSPSNPNIGPISQTETAIVQKTQAVAPPAAASTQPAGAQPLTYGQSEEGTLAAGAISSWVFSGVAGDAVTISAVPAEDSTVDIVLSLIGPDGTTLVQAGASDAESDATISNYSLTEPGEYTIEISTLAGTGAYSISLNTGTASTGYVLPVSGSGSIEFLPYYQDDGTATPEQGDGTPTPEQGDQFLGETTTGAEGEFDFGQLEPGVYYLVVRYEDLPEEIQAQIATPTELVTIKVTIPTVGQAIFEFPTPTAEGDVEPTRVTPQPSPLVSQTAASTTTGLQTVTSSPTSEPGTIVASPTALQNTGVLSDAGDTLSEGNGLFVLAIAAAGLVAVVFAARKLRTS